MHLDPSVLSPCVLPLLPILATSALAKHRFGIVALAGGLAISFAGVGIFLATPGAGWQHRGAQAEADSARGYRCHGEVCS